MLRRLPIAIALVASLLAACGEDHTVIQLEVNQSVVIEFGMMEGDQFSETAPGDIAFDLRSDANWVRLSPQLQCAALDPAASTIEITRLLAPGLETMLTLQVDVMPLGGVTWRPLAELNGTVVDGESIRLDDPSVVLSTEGRELLEALALSSNPLYELRVSGEVPDAIDALDVRLSLWVDFSSEPGQCPIP